MPQRTKVTREIEIGHSKLVLETGYVAQQANGSCMVRCGDTVVLTTACMSGNPKQPRPFLPLTIEYREQSAAAGRIPGGFFKREGRPSEKETISARLTDRPLRPLFPKGYYAETQVISFIYSADEENDPDVLAINGASTALTISDIPFYHPVGAVRVGLIDGELVFNPTNSERDVSDLDLIVVGTEDAVTMVEAGANQLTEDVVLNAIFRGHEELQKIIAAQKELAAEIGKEKPVWDEPEAYPQDLYADVSDKIKDDLNRALHTVEKFARAAAVREVVDGYLAQYEEHENFDDIKSSVKKIISDLEEDLLAAAVLQSKRRFDGRALDEIRDIWMDTQVLPRTHGSAIFTRGETQALATATLGTRRDAQIIEDYAGDSMQKFLLHYNFPPFSVGECRFLRGPGRREIGHGVLARRALTPVLPHEDDFPYTIRVVSDILESNGSSSMATVCGGSLAMFDVGVPLLAPVAGVAMGLIKRGDDFAVLSDIAGQEDHHGDMDFKVAGTRDGITALQMDIKITGVSEEIMGTALAQAKAGREHILDRMEAHLPEPREEISALAPRLYTLEVPRDKVRDIIGPGGKTIRAIQEETGCEVEVDDGKVTVAAPDGLAAKRAIEMIERLTEVPEVGKTYEGIVTRVEGFGAFVEILPGTEGLLHVSEVAPFRVKDVNHFMREGDQVRVKVLEIDSDKGRIRLSRRAALLDDPNYDEANDPLQEFKDEGGSRDGGGDRGGRSGGRDGGRGGRGRDGGRGRGGRGGRR
ncbi:MAG: polyribonucleotide nucleotidyltransferase [Thermoanaerobaculia bacterium]|nr:polyribonucleotide nucleotidyltransferase [Thermoanaerobaculia bacterium]